ncbi:protein SRC2 isoform X2 [Syzygium oleosum]|uniref:protein SRC2 isoform X2 n=1 Tax=Syzygium oleosum TaxID=219896 RepID=UPI0024B949D9|nr:protein SRC2 isoform X2 [Syzygium oleosum]
MASRYELEVTVSSARDLKNVNWRRGQTRAYAVLWVDPSNKCSTRVDEEGDTCPVWDQTLAIPLPPGPIEDQTLYIDVVHAGSEEDTKPLIGSARIKLRDVLDEAGFGEPLKRTPQLKRPSGRPHGKVDVKVCVREPRYRAPDPYRETTYGVPPATREYAPPVTREYAPPPPAYANPYAAPQHSPYYAAAPPAGGYSYGSYNAPPPQPQYGQPSYGQAPQYGYGGEQAPAYGGQYGQEEKKKSKFGGMGMGTGLAVGAVAGALGGIALAEGFDHLEDKIADDAAEKVEEDPGDDDGGGYEEDDF